MLRQFDCVLVKLQLLDANVRFVIELTKHFTFLSLILQILHTRILCQSNLTVLLFTLLFEGEALTIPALLIDCLLVYDFACCLSNSVKFGFHLHFFVFVLLFKSLQEVILFVFITISGMFFAFFFCDNGLFQCCSNFFIVLSLASLEFR